MRQADFDNLVRDFAAFDAEVDESQNQLPTSPRPGQWLTSSIGLRLTCVGLGYRDGYWAERYLKVVDTRSPSEMIEWDGRTARGWARRNVRLVPKDIRANGWTLGQSTNRAE